jgi:hypothetical protein
VFIWRFLRDNEAVFAKILVFFYGYDYQVVNGKKSHVVDIKTFNKNWMTGRCASQEAGVGVGLLISNVMRSSMLAFQ